MDAICKVNGIFELVAYSGYLTPEFEYQNRFSILENGMIEIDSHFSLTEAIILFKDLINENKTTI
jgi:hypothetical protein